MFISYMKNIFDKCKFEAKKMPLKEAVDRAIRECIKEGILSDFLRDNMTEARRMSVLFENTLFGHNDEPDIRMWAYELLQQEQEKNGESIERER